MAHFSRGSQVLVEPTLALILPAGSASRVSHPLAVNDDCLVIEFSEPCFQQVVESTCSSNGAPFPATHAVLNPNLTAARNLIHYRLKNRLTNPLEVEETALALLMHSIRAAGQHPIPLRKNSKVAKQIDAAKIVVQSFPERNWSLNTLACALDCSPYHLTRMFHAYIGVPLHRYHLQARLSRSIDLLLETNTDLTTIALDLGFSSHSHFTASFRRTIGFTPGYFRANASSRIAFEIRKILTALLS
jgi:AraC-like DNA-binding protein